MKLLLDTDTAVFWLRGHVPVLDRLKTVGPEAVCISVLTLAELRYGAACSSRPETNHQAIDDFVNAIDILGVDRAIARIFGDLKATLRSQGTLIEDFDLLIAATALAHGLTLVTNNLVHFSRFPGLSLESWT